jgi:amino acid adenylation domain-containing protein
VVGPDLELKPVDFDPFAAPELSGTAPSTEAQREIWTAVQMGDDASAAFNESISLTLEGELDTRAYHAAMQELVARHEALRTTLSADGVTLCVAARLEIPIPSTDLSALDVRERDVRVRALLKGEVETPFQLEHGPLFRTQLVRLGPASHLSTFTAHHIVCDGWSMAVMLRDLSELYSAKRRNTTATLDPATPFGEYARGERVFEGSPEYEASERYWMQKLSGSLPTLELPLDGPRPPAKTYSSIREDYLIDPSLVERVKKVGAKNGASFFTTLLGAFYVLLARLSGSDDLIVGIPAAGQSVTGQPDLVGHCVNTLPLRASIDPAQPISAFLKQLRTTMLDAYEHQRCTFGSLIKKLSITRDPSRLPLVSVLFNVDQAVSGDALKFEGLRATYRSTPRSFENFEIFINAAETRGRVVLECQFNTDLFSTETIHRWLAAYEELLRGIAQDDTCPIGAIPILPDDERSKLVYLWNATFADFPRDIAVHRLFEAQARRTPDAVAVVSEGTSITFAELDARANQLARRLRGAGVRRETLVGLALTRSVDMVVAISAILKAGGAYVPLDPAFPRDRIAFMIDDSKMSVIVTEERVSAELPPGDAHLLHIDTGRAAIEAESRAPLDASDDDATPESLAYVIYTSGSTGKPKGVMVPHRAVVNFVTSMAREPGLTEKDVLLAVTTLSFDIAVLELHLPLSVGAKIVLATRDTATDGVALASHIAKHGVTVMQATPSTWRLLLAAGWKGSDSFKVLVGGEALPRDLAGELCRRAGSVWNMYGPTETTVWSTCHRVTNPSRILVGKAIANTTVYILDERMIPVPIGIPGELHIGGDGVTRGYLHRPELTSERFVTDPFSGDPTSRLYKTGDLARFLPDGNIEYLRRNDSQVKLRGYRIELGEIEASLTVAPGVKQAAVSLREIAPGDVRLVGYVISEGTPPSDAELRAHVRKTLPDYMTPQHFVRLTVLPLTPNGKLDRKALPAPSLDEDDQRAHREPRTPTETAIVEVFREVLGVKRVSVDDNFFDLGGHSLLAAQAFSRLQQRHGIALPLRRMFEAPSPEALARLVESQAKSDVAPVKPPSIPRRNDTGVAPLSLMQQRLWLLEKLDPGLSVYNLPSAFRFRGELYVEALVRAVNAIVERHEPVRTRFRVENGEPGQDVMPGIDLALSPVHDLSDRPAAQREAELLELLRAEAGRPFDLVKGPLVRGSLYRLAADEHVLFWMPHHAIWDGWSFDVFLNELDVLYTAFAAGKESPLPPLPIRYQDFAAWHRDFLQGEELERQAAYWRTQLGGELPILELPTDKPRPARLSYRGQTESFVLSKAEVDTLTLLGRRANATLYMVLLGAFQTLLYRYTGQEDVIVGTPIRGRTQPETENLLGFFVNTLVFRTDLSKEPSFLELLERVRRVALDAYGHQDMPFELLVQQLGVQRDMSRTPIFQAFFTYQDVSNRQPRLGELGYSQVHVHAPVAPTDVYLWVKETGQGLSGGIDYSTDLFEKETIARFLKQLRRLLAAICEDPTQSIARIPILPDAERRAIADVSETTAPYPREAGVHELVQRRAATHPDRVAVEWQGRTLTYGELDERAGRLATRLRELGVEPGGLVGLYVERSPSMLIAMLAILKAGGGYIPLDPAFPADRLAFMVEDSGVRVLVSERALEASLPPQQGRVLYLDDPDSYESGGSSLTTSGGGDGIAYVIYTSGSTGKPKGVMVPHRAVVNFLTSVAELPGLGEDDTVLAVTTLSFDIAVLELWLPLAFGAKIVLATRDDAMDGTRLLGLLRSSKATVLQATPSTWRLLLAAGLRAGDLGKALVGGEAVPKELAEELALRAGSAWNMYGPTETTVWSTCAALKSPVERVLIGRPLQNTKVHVVDRNGELVPFGVPGELLIGGDGVTLGYLNRPELTREKFIDDPFASGRAYRTGDVVRLLASGSIEYLRRNDNQIKLRGYRIELGEIESAIAQHPSVRQAVALVREDRPGDARLVAYVVENDGAAVTDAELRTHLRRFLPEYMVPQHFVELATLPLTPNGKIDRKALPAPGDVARTVEKEFVEPATEGERIMAGLWSTILGVERISATDSFFELGGHSLLAAKLVTLLTQKAGVDLPLRAVFETPRLRALAELVESRPEPTSQRLYRTAIPRRTSTGPAPLSLMQQRIFFLEEMAPGTAVFNIQVTLRLLGALDVSVLARSVETVAERHEVMRSTLVWQDGEPVQSIAPRLVLDLTPVDLRGLAEDERRARVRTVIGEFVNSPFQLSKGPLVRFKLIRLGDEEYTLTTVAHHSIWDGSSFDIFQRELGVAYESLLRGTTPSYEPLPITYGDFSAWTRVATDAARRELPYWTNKLGGELPILELPSDRPRPPVMTYRAGTVTRLFSAEDVAAIGEFSRREGVTLYMLLVAVYATLLYRHTGQTDVILGTPVQGRQRPGTEGLLGFFANTLVLRIDLKDQPTFSEVLRRVRDVCLDAYAHQEMPIETLIQVLNVPRDGSRTPLYQAIFSLQSRPKRDNRLGNLEYGYVDIDRESTPTDISLWVEETSTGMSATLEYAQDLFDAGTMEAMLSRYDTLLRALVENPLQSIGRAPVVPAEERKAMAAVNETDAAYPQESGLHELVEKRVAMHPDRIAVEASGEKLTYGELDARAGRLAAKLRELGVGRDVFVGLYVERSATMLVAMLATLKAGGAYIPLDPAFPADRLAFMVEDSGVGVILSQRSLESTVPPHRGRVLFVDEPDSYADAPARGGTPSTGNAIGYVIYTSGSTGKPKGVMVPHRAIVNFVTSIASSPGLDESDVVLAVTTLSFDIAVLELWLPLSVGAKIVLANKDEASDGERLLALLRSSGATTLQATPGTWRLLMAAGLRSGELKKALVGGEAVPRELGEQIASLVPSSWNMYGPTETTVWSTCAPLEPQMTQVLIGRPLQNTKVYVVDTNGELCPLGVPGELLIGGDGVTLGYLNRAELTEERFIADPILPSGRAYRTGDVVRLLASGDLQYLRRNDNQVKLRGYRIELGEIETTLARHDAVKQAVALVREDRPGDARLVAYLVKSEGAMATDSELRRHLRGFLPDYMVPQHFVEIREFPLTPNGKIDRKALPAPFATVETETYEEPTTPAERLVADVWKEVLGAPRVSLGDNFFGIGGHSLLSLRVIAEIEARTGARLSPRVLLLNNLLQVAAQLAPMLPTAARSTEAPAPEQSRYVPLASRLLKKVRQKIRGL